jgi:hypothetical protein
MTGLVIHIMISDDLVSAAGGTQSGKNADDKVGAGWAQSGKDGAGGAQYVD